MSVKSEVMNEESIIEPTAAVCSCTDCDSGKCFEKRYQNSIECTCKKCKNSNTCLFYSYKNLNLSSSDLTMKQNKPVVKNGNSNTRPITKVQCRSQGLETTRMKSFTSSTVEKGHQKEFFKNETYYKSDGTKTFTHKQTKYSHNKMPEQSAGGKKEYEVTVVQSMTVPYSKAEMTSSTGKLTAQIMNVPYTDFKNSISFNKPKISKTKLTKNDILQRIKDAYNACTCKVCECIATISPIQRETCNCKPCECDDCKKGKLKLSGTQRKIKENVKTFFHTRNESRNESLSQKQCGCEPCQCIKCKSMANRKTPIKTIIVAPVEDNHRRYCQCNPCGCFECGHVYGAINTNVTHEMSTGISRHPTCRCETCLNEACERDGADDCRCDRRSKIMRKPVERDTHDFDIRRADFSSHNETTRDDKKSTKYDTIAMFATLSQRIPETERGCDCDQCACAKRECIDEIANAFKTPRNYDFIQNLYNKPQEPNACECSPCNCEICTNREVVEQNRNCKCDVCDCIQCANINRPFCSNKNVNMKALNTSSKNDCDCEHCACVECRGDRCNNHTRWILSNETTELVEPIKKGQLLGFSESKTNYSNRNISARCYNKSVSPYSQVSSTKSSDQDLFIYHTLQQHAKNYQDGLVRNTITKPVSPQSGTYSDEKDTDVANRKKSIVEFDTDVQTKNREVNLPSGNSKDCNASGSYISAFATYATTSRMSYNNESGTVSPVSLRRHAHSWDGSCNSSGHDHSDYLIQFPRKTVETCINDVMNLRYERKLNFNQLKTPSKSPSSLLYPHFTFSSSNQNPNSTMHPIPAGKIYYPKVCKNWNAENPCECDQCLCDKCSYKKLKYKKCNCECSSCNCRGMCLREDLSILIRKNESTQTKQLVSDRGQDSADDKLMSKPNCDSFGKAKIVPDLQELEVSKDEDTRIQRHKLKAFNESFCTGNNINNFVKDDFRHWGSGYRSLDSYLNSDLDLLSVNIYESVHKTIKEARAFSIDLMNILQKYEKANMEFVSVSQKLKQSHKEMLDTYNAKETQQIETKNTEKGNDNTEINYLEQKHDANVVNKDHEPLIDKSNNDFTKNEFDNAVVKPEDEHKLTNSTNYHTMTSDSTKNDKPKCSLHFDNENDSKLSKCSDDGINYKHIKEKHEAITFNGGALDIIKEVLTNMDILENRKTYKKYRKLIKRAVVTAKRNYMKSNDTNELSVKPDVSLENVDEKQLTPLPNTTKQTPQSETTKQPNNIIEKDNEQRNIGVSIKTASRGVVSSIPHVSGNIDLTAYRNMSDSSDEIKSRNHNQETEKIQEKIKSWQERKKNFIINSMPFDKYKVKKTPYLELEVKGAVECISPKTGKTIEMRKTIAAPYGNKALENVLLEVKKMYNLPLVQRRSEDKSERNRSTSNIDFDISSASVSQMQCVLKEKSDEVVSSCSKGTNFMIAERAKDTSYLPSFKIPSFKNFRSRSELKPAVKGHSFGSNSTSSAGVDPARVEFQTVRKVSDHTILVKWNAPRDCTGVKGYELLVDGRAVKKILGPTRCMAVVTCLPHSDKVVLTIRTIKSATGQQAKHTATTIVYNPRRK